MSIDLVIQKIRDELQAALDNAPEPTPEDMALALARARYPQAEEIKVDRAEITDDGVLDAQVSLRLPPTNFINLTFTVEPSS